MNSEARDATGERRRSEAPPRGRAYLRGRHAIVTGGGRGIGAAIATELGRLGARLTLMGRDVVVAQRHAAAVSREFETEADGVECDVSDGDSITEAFARARGTFGDVHVLVNNAGQAEGGLLTETSPELWDRISSSISSRIPVPRSSAFDSCSVRRPHLTVACCWASRVWRMPRIARRSRPHRLRALSP